MAYEIIDNFLEEEAARSISDIMLGSSEFPWYYNDAVVSREHEDTIYNYLFTHRFYGNYQWTSEYANIVVPIVQKIKPWALIRIKANLSPVTPINYASGWHVDYDFQCKTAVYYINTNNGFTEFENGERVESVANRLIVFDSDMRHNGSTATDTKSRCLINLNYIV